MAKALLKTAVPRSTDLGPSDRPSGQHCQEAPVRLKSDWEPSDCRLLKAKFLALSLS